MSLHLTNQRKVREFLRRKKVRRHPTPGFLAVLERHIEIVLNRACESGQHLDANAAFLAVSWPAGRFTVPEMGNRYQP